MRIDPVQSMVAEKSALGAAILDPLATKQLVTRLSPADFQNEANRAVFQAIKKLEGEGIPPDFATLYAELEDAEPVKRIGGLDYIIEICNFAPSAVNMEHYVNMVLENGREARITEGMRRVVVSDDPSLPQLRKLIEDEESKIKPVETGMETAETIAAYLDEICDGGERALFTTGLPRFDNDLGGLPRGSVSIIAARPRVGKTSLALGFDVHNFYTGYRTAYFSLEMTKPQLLDRVSAMTARVPYGAIHKRRLEQGHKTAISKELADFTTGNRFHLFDNVRSTSGIISEAARVKADMIFVDYIQKVHPDERRQKRNEEIETIMDRFKEAAISLNAHFCILSQISREGADRPKLEYLKESGAIEEGGDIVMLLHRKAINEGRQLTAEGMLIVAKHKYGEEGAVELVFDGTHQRFIEIAKEAGR